MSHNALSSPLPEDVETLTEIIRQQAATIDAQQRELERIKNYVDRLLRARFGPRSEKVDPRQLELFDAPEACPGCGKDGCGVAGCGEGGPGADGLAAAVEDELEEVVVVRKKRRGGGRTELPPGLPRVRVEHDLPEAEKLCPCCGKTRERIGSETSEQLEYVPASLHVLEHIRFKYACLECEEHVAIAPPPAKPIEKGLPGPGLLAAIAVSKAGDHLPCYRQEDILARHGVDISRQTMSRWLRGTADLLIPLADYMADLARQSCAIHTDDTTVPVLDPTLPHTRTGRFWIYAGDADHPYCIYDYTPSRKRDGPATFLADYTGYLQADAFAGYDGIYASQDVKQVLCWAHARRKFFDAHSAQPIESACAMAYIARLYAVEKEAAAVRPVDFRTNPAAREAWFEQRYVLRQMKSLPILAEFHRWLEAAGRSVLPKSPIGEAINYVLPRWDGFTRYCEAGFLAIDNNLAERMLRPCAIGRKNWLFVGEDRGGTTVATLYTVVMSAKANQVEPWAYLRDVLTTLATINARRRIAGQYDAGVESNGRASSGLDRPRLNSTGPTEAELHALLPDVWLTNHPKAHRPWSR